MIGVLVNTLAVIVGSAAGIVFKKAIPERISNAIMTGIALCTVYIGISGSLKGENTLILIISIVIGAAVGTLLDIDGGITKLGSLAERKLSSGDRQGTVAQAFITASLLFCVGAMTIVGSLNAGLTGDNEMLFTKSVLDLISAVMLTVSLGPGVMLSAAFVLVFQGLIALFAGVIAPVLSDGAVNEMICSGSVLIMALGLNMLGITKIKVANYMPAILVAPLLVWLTGLF